MAAKHVSRSLSAFVLAVLVLLCVVFIVLVKTRIIIE